MSDPTNAWPLSGLERCHACPACGSTVRCVWAADLPDRLFGSAVDLWSFHRCGDCGSAYIDPRPNRETIADAYRDYYTHAPIPTGDALPGGALAARRRALRHGYLNRKFGLALDHPSRLGPVLVPMIPGLARRQRQWARLPQPHRGATLLDVGSGSGAAIAHFRRLGWKATGIDIDHVAVENAHAAGLSVTRGEITELQGSARFDAITMTHAIEHLHEPVAAFRAAFRLMKPGGAIEVATPNIDSIGSRAYRRDWLGLDPPRHLILFTARGLTRALGNAGFVRIALHRPERSAAWYFHASEALRRGEPWTGDTPLRPQARAALTASHVCTRVLRRFAEELLVTAERPLR